MSQYQEYPQNLFAEINAYNPELGDFFIVSHLERPQYTYMRRESSHAGFRSEPFHVGSIGRIDAVYYCVMDGRVTYVDAVFMHGNSPVTTMISEAKLSPTATEAAIMDFFTLVDSNNPYYADLLLANALRDFRSLQKLGNYLYSAEYQTVPERR